MAETKNEKTHVDGRVVALAPSVLIALGVIAFFGILVWIIYDAMH